MQIAPSNLAVSAGIVEVSGIELSTWPALHIFETAVSSKRR